MNLDKKKNEKLFKKTRKRGLETKKNKRICYL